MEGNVPQNQIPLSRLEEIAAEVHQRDFFANMIEELYREADLVLEPRLKAINGGNEQEVALFNAQMLAHMDLMEITERLRLAQCAIISYLETGANDGTDEYHGLLLSRARLIVERGQLSLKRRFLFDL